MGGGRVVMLQVISLPVLVLVLALVLVLIVVLIVAAVRMLIIDAYEWRFGESDRIES